MKFTIILMKKIVLRINSIIKVFIWKIFYFKSLHVYLLNVFYPNTHITFEKNGKLIIGKNCFFNRNCSLNTMKSISIGNNCIFGENVCIYDHNHKFSNKEQLIKKQGYNCKDVVIGDNCWICSNVIILAGANIGPNSIIGAGCVVSGDIPKNSIVRLDKKNIVIEERR